MKKVISLLSLALTLTMTVNADPPAPPVAKKVPKTTEIHGYKLTDNYFWLREKANPEVIKYLEDENAYTDEVMKPTAALQETLYKEMLGRIKQTDNDVPYRYGDYFYYSRTEEGKQYPILCRKKGSMDAAEQVVIDMNEMAKGLKFLSLGAYSISDDGNLLAFSTDTTGYRQYTLKFKDLRTGQMLADTAERVGSIVWANDGKTVFYTTEDDVSKRSDKLWKHTLGGKSELVYQEKDEEFDIFAYRTRDKSMIFLGSQAKTVSEYRYLPANQPNGQWKVLYAREKDHEYGADFDKGMFYVRTNKAAKNFRVVAAPLDKPNAWKDLVPANDKVKIEDTDFFANHAVISERENGLQYIRVMDMRTKKSHRIQMPEPLYTTGPGVNREYNTNVLRFGYQSMITPASVFDYDMDKKTRTLLKQQPVLGGYDAKNYETKRLWVSARDGVKVPLSVVHKKGVKIDGTAPMMLYAYGSYGISMAPTFSSSRVSLLDRGVIWVTAHIRGGGELGEPWREAGRMMNKINTFNDFIDAADWLVKNKYTKPDRLVIQGGSAGGLLMGAVVNMRPDLFKASIAQVPFVDVINTMLDASLPLTTSEYTEWGNPNEKAAFDYMMRYSPYDNVKAQNYPNLLVKVSLNDSQVPYWEGAKFAAKIRSMKTDNNTVLLKTNMGAGHGGSSGRYDALREVAFDYAYMLQNMGLN
jgi:oligopeptidase B